MRSLHLFTSPTCVSCPAFKALVQEVAAAKGLTVSIYDVTEVPEHAQAFHIRSVPTLLIVEGDRVVGQSGPVPRGRLEALLGD